MMVSSDEGNNATRHILKIMFYRKKNEKEIYMVSRQKEGGGVGAAFKVCLSY